MTRSMHVDRGGLWPLRIPFSFLRVGTHRRVQNAKVGEEMVRSV